MATKYKQWDLIEIFWHDSYMVHGWTHVENIGLDEDISLDHRSVGYYLGETPRQITICQSSKTHEELIDQPETNVCGVFTIPKKAITKVTGLVGTDLSLVEAFKSAHKSTNDKEEK